MSAFMVDRNHIRYLIEAAENVVFPDKSFRWNHNGTWHELERANNANETEVGQMLWDANRKSIETLYPDTCGPNFAANAPGPIGENFIYRHDPAMYTYKAAQIIKSAHCFMYQSCGMPEWTNSNAFAFITQLIDYTIRQIPEYDGAIWGAPEPTSMAQYLKSILTPR